MYSFLMRFNARCTRFDWGKKTVCDGRSFKKLVSLWELSLIIRHKHQLIYRYIPQVGTKQCHIAWADLEGSHEIRSPWEIMQSDYLNSPANQFTFRPPPPPGEKILIRVCISVWPNQYLNTFYIIICICEMKQFTCNYWYIFIIILLLLTTIWK